jgi:hypothetical protein
VEQTRQDSTRSGRAGKDKAAPGGVERKKKGEEKGSKGGKKGKKREKKTKGRT